MDDTAWLSYPSQLAQLTNVGLNAVSRMQKTRVHTFEVPSGVRKQFGWPSHIIVTFPALIKDCWSCEATDPRDKIYALYDIAHPGSSKTLATWPKVDYREPWQSVYTKVARWMYETGRPDAAQTIYYAGRSLQKSTDIPSWVPDWRHAADQVSTAHWQWVRAVQRYPPTARFMDLKSRRREAPGLTPYKITDAANRLRNLWRPGMELSAIMVDKIVYRNTAPIPDADNFKSVAGAMRDLIRADLQYLEKHVPYYMTGERAEEAYAATLIANTNNEGIIATKDFEETFSAYREWVYTGCEGPVPAYAWVVEEGLEAFSTNAFCVTAHGFMGLVPGMTKVGDYVAVAPGFRLPVTLRRAKGCPHPYYELLGSAYVHRLMRGRIWNLLVEFKCKYQQGSEDSVPKAPLRANVLAGAARLEDKCEGFPFNPKADYEHVVKVIGKRKIVLV